MPKLLSVIIPAYNEESSIEQTLSVVFNVPPLKEVVVINDGSQDNTKDILEKVQRLITESKPPFLSSLTIVNKDKNEGKGAALRTALQHVRGDIVLIQDADLELDPHEYPRLLEPFETLDADVVFGSRFRREGVMRVHETVHFLGNKFLTWVSNFCTGLYLTDMETCYKIMKTSVFKSFPITSNRFGIDPELTARVAREVKTRRLNFYEVPVSYRPRTTAEGKKMKIFKDGFVVLSSIFYFNLLIPHSKLREGPHFFIK